MRAPDLREPLKRASACARYQKAAGPQRGASHTARAAAPIRSAAGQPRDAVAATASAAASRTAGARRTKQRHVIDHARHGLHQPGRHQDREKVVRRVGTSSRPHCNSREDVSLERGTLANPTGFGNPEQSVTTSPSTGATSPACPARGAPADVRRGGMGADDPLQYNQQDADWAGPKYQRGSTARAPPLWWGLPAHLRPADPPRSVALRRQRQTPTAARAATASRPRPTAPGAA